MSGEWSFPWEREAMRGDPLPDSLSLADMYAYTTLRNIYAWFREGRTSREQAHREKLLLHREWKQAQKQNAFDCKLAFFQARLHKDTEMAATAVRKDPSPENAIMLCNVLDGLVKYRPEAEGDDTVWS